MNAPLTAEKPRNRASDLVAALLASLVLFTAVVVGLQAAPTALHCHHDRGLLSWRGVHLICTADHVTRLSQLGR